MFSIVNDSFKLAIFIFIGVNVMFTLAGDMSGWLTTIGFHERLLEVVNWIFKLFINFFS